MLEKTTAKSTTAYIVQKWARNVIGGSSVDMG